MSVMEQVKKSINIQLIFNNYSRQNMMSLKVIQNDKMNIKKILLYSNITS